MKTLLVVFVLCLISVSLSEKKRYDGYKVLRIAINGTNYDTEEVLNLSERILADVWAINILDGWMDVMVSPSQLGAFSKYDSKIHIDDVQVSLDESEEDRRKSRIVGDFFTDFPTVPEVLVWLYEEIDKRPDVAEGVVIGETYNGEQIHGIVIGGGASKPAIYIHCTIHAREWITTTSCAWIIESLLATDPAGPGLINAFEWVIIPVFNVDGYTHTHNVDRLWRKSRSPNSGSTCIGTDINRNYGYAWGGAGSSASPCSETYRGSSAWSTPEATSERNFLQPYINQGRLRIYFDIHSYGAYFMSAWGYTVNPPADYAEMDSFMTSATNAIYNILGRTYTQGSSGRVLYLTSGGTVDWTYGDGGVVQSYTIEAFGSSFTPPTSWIQPIAREIWAGVKQVATDVAIAENLF